MTLLWRRTDLFAAVGLVLLLAITPGYMAASDVERGIETDGTHPVRPLHIGDGATYAVIVTQGDDSWISPPIADVVVSEGPGPGHTVVWTHHAINLTIGPVTYQTHRTEMRLVHDEAGRLVWAELDGIETTEAAELPVADWPIERRHHLGMHGPHIPPALRPLTSDTLPHRLEPVHAVFEDLEKKPGEHAFVAAETHGSLLLGLHPRTATPETAPLASIDGRPSGQLPRPHIVLDHPLPTNVLHLATPLDWSQMRSWDWQTPALALPAGFHQELLDATGQPLLTIDMVPTRIETGDTLLRSETDAPASPHGPETIALSALGRDTEPLHQNLSLDDIRRALQAPDTPERVRQFMEAGGLLSEYTFQRGRLATDFVAFRELPEAASTPIPTNVLEGDWRITLTNRAGHVQVVALHVEEVLGADHHRIEAVDLCASPEHDDPWRSAECGAVPSALTRPERPIVPPGAILRQLDAFHTAHGHDHDLGATFSYLPLYRVHDNSTTDPIDGSPTKWSRNELGSLGWRPAEWPTGMAIARHRGQDFVDLASGQVLLTRDRERVPLEDAEAAAPPSHTASAATPPDLVQVVDERALLIGILMIFLAILARAWNWLVTKLAWGTAATLYTRIRPEKATRHRRRALILAHLETQPGATLKEIAESLDLAWGVTVHHLQILERSGHITSIAEGRTRHFFTKGLARHEMILRVAQQKGDYRTFLDAVASRPGVPLAKLADMLGRDRPATSRTGTRLARLGLVEKQTDAGRLRYFPAVPSVGPRATKPTGSEVEGTARSG